MAGVVESDRHVRVAGELDEPGLQLTNLVVQRRRETVLGHVHLGVLPGSITALWGAEGSGKTTLMRTAAGILRPDRGTVRVAGVDIGRQPERARGLTGWLPAQRTDLGAVTPHELLRTFAAGHRLPERTGRLRVAELLERTGLTRLADTAAGRLRLPQQSLLMLACATIHAPAVLLLDEPFAGLSSEDRATMSDMLRAEAGRGAAVLATAPDPFLLDEVAHRSVCLEAGRVTSSIDLTDAEGGRTWRIVSLDGPLLRRVLDDHGVDYEEIAPPGGHFTQRAAVDVAMAHEEEATALLTALAQAGVPVYGFGPGAAAPGTGNPGDARAGDYRGPRPAGFLPSDGGEDAQ